MVRRIAIVPARGGSKRIPNKNIRDFCGKPMVGHILDAARTSGLFDVIHVSTDSQTIFDVVSHLGFTPDFARPSRLADDHTPLIPVLQWTVAEYGRRGQSFDEAWLLMACAPLITPDHLRMMAERLAELGACCNALMAISPFAAPVQRGFVRGDGDKLIPIAKEEFNTRTQDLPVTYHDAGAIDIYRLPFLLETENPFWAELFYGFVLPRWATVDIDNEEDWVLAEALFRGLHQRPSSSKIDL